MTELACVADGPDAIVSVRLTPRASRTEVAGIEAGVLRVRVTAPPVDGAANAAAISCLAQTLRVAKTRLSIEAGHSSRNKRIRVAKLTCAEVSNALNAAD